MNKKAQAPITILGTALGAVAIGAIVMAQTNKPPASVTVKKSGAKLAADEIPAAAVVAERKPLSYYTGGVRTDLFSAPTAQEPVKTAAPIVKKQVLPDPGPAVVQPPPSPIADYSYTGTVTMGTQMMALVENTKTKEGQYVKEGDSFRSGDQTGKVTQVGTRTVTIEFNGKTETLAKSDNYSLTPLDKSAPFLQAQPGGPGMPGMPGGMVPGMAGGMPGASPDRAAMMEQWLQRLPPDQQAAMRERMQNRQFNGGGNRGGGGGGAMGAFGAGGARMNFGGGGQGGFGNNGGGGRRRGGGAFGGGFGF